MPRKARRRAWGSITTATRNRHIIRWVEDTPQGRKRRSKTIYGTYREADAELSRIHANLGGDGPTKTVAYVHNEWYWPDLLRKAKSGKPSKNTLSTYERIWKSFIVERWGNIPVSQIRRLDVQKWLHDLTGSNGQMSIIVLRGILDSAVKYEEIETNNLRGVSFEFGENQRKRRKDVYSLEEAERVLEEIKGLSFEAAFILACFGGCRTGESLAVRCDDIETFEYMNERAVLAHICKQMEATGHKPVNTVKTAESNRWTAIPSPYGERLLEIKEKKESLGIEWLTDRDDGLPMNRGLLQYRWSQQPRIPFSNLRPSWRTFAEFSWHVPSDTLEIMMGHVIPGTTGKHYLRASKEDIARSMCESMAHFHRN